MANQKICMRRKKEEGEKIDLIPKCVQQPRSRTPGGPKRRTDFSLFFCSQFSPPCSSIRDFSPESHCSKDGLIEAKHGVLQGRSKEIRSFHLILCCQTHHEGERFSLEYSDIRGKEAESSSNVYEQKDDIERTVESTPEKLLHSGSKEISQASLGQERLTCSDSDNASINGHASVKRCGTGESALLQSVKSSSRGQAGLLRRRDILPSKKLGKDPEPGYSDENDQPFGKLKSSSSSKVDEDILNGGRGKRKRKPKVHFDELADPEEPVTKSRRLKIMRYLGLSAPAGSPFILPHQ